MAKTITTYLMSDNPNGPRYVLISNKICKMLIVPRDEINVVNSREEFTYPCLYILLSGEEEKIAYIGQTESFRKRVTEHKQSKQFWDKALVFIANDHSISKSDILYLEYKAIKEALNAAVYNLGANAQIPSCPSLPEYSQESMNEFFKDVKFLTAFAGYDIFLKMEVKNKSVYYLSSRGANAQAYYDEEGKRLILLKGSIIAPDCTTSFAKGRVFEKREKLKIDICKLLDGKWVVQKDYPFNSPSTAADFCIGNSSNGWEYWKDKEGRTLNEIFRQK